MGEPWNTYLEWKKSKTFSMVSLHKILENANKSIDIEFAWRWEGWGEEVGGILKEKEETLGW